MMPRNSLSPAGIALADDYGGGALLLQRAQETEEIRRKKMLAAQNGGFSPAGIALAGYGLLSNPPGGAAQ